MYLSLQSKHNPFREKKIHQLPSWSVALSANQEAQRFKSFLTFSLALFSQYESGKKRQLTPLKIDTGFDDASSCLTSTQYQMSRASQAAV